MAQNGFTPLKIYASSTTTNVPLAANLTNDAFGSEIAINITDGILFYKDNLGVVQELVNKLNPVLSSLIVNGLLTINGQGYSPNINLTDAATIAWNASLGQVATFTFVSSSRTMGTPTNLKNGAFYALKVVQASTPNTLTWSSAFKWQNGSAPTLSTGSGAIDIFTFESDGTNLYETGRSQAIA